MKKLVFLSAIFFCLLYPPARSPALGEKPPQYNAGFRSIGVASQGGELAGSIAVWYPSARQGRARYTTRTGEWSFAAERNAKPAYGSFPAILVSHDMAGHNLANHDLALALARHGFVVIVPTHYGDSLNNADAAFSAALYYHRPRQLAAALQTLKKTPELREMADFSRLGLLGVGVGAVTALQLAGADLDPEAAPAFCAENPDDPVFCNAWALSRQRRIPADAAELKKKYGAAAFRPSLDGAAASGLADGADEADAAGGDKIRAVGLLAPGGLFMLERRSLSALTVPLGVVFAAEDEFFPVPGGAGLAAMLPPALASRTAALVCANTDHYSLAAPCPESVADLLPGLCGRSGPAERDAAAKNRDAFFISFFRLHLGPPLPADATAGAAP